MQLLQIVPILICDSKKELMPKNVLKRFLNLFQTLHQIVFLIFKETLWTPTVFKAFEDLTDKFVNLLTCDSFRNLSPSKMNIVKLHMLYHFPYFVKWYGSPMNFDAGT